MAAARTSTEISARALRAARALWSGVLPEALGLCFVATILGSFAAAYVLTDYGWQQRVAIQEQAHAQTAAQSLALALAGCENEGTEAVLWQNLNRLPGLRAVRWMDGSGSVRATYPPGLPVVGALPGAAGAQHNVTAEAPVRDARGALAGKVQVVFAAGNPLGWQNHLWWTWSGTATAALLTFLLVYSLLRRHLRPIGAIERTLQRRADGVERGLTTLLLSDALGPVARGWNALIAEHLALQQQVQQATASGPHGDVAARFESAIFRQVVERLPFGVLCVGDLGEVKFANATAGALLGRPIDELVGSPARKVIDNLAIVQAVATVAHGPRSGVVLDHTARSGESETTLRFRILPLGPQVAGTEALVTIEDISQLREGERARDNFLYHVTHELRTPLTNIHAYTETLTQPDFDDEQTRKECYNVIISETERLSRLVENILSISQLEVGTARLDVGEVDLARLVRQMVQDNLGAADEKRIDLTLALPPKLPKVRGDKQRLSVLLNNLIGNAIKYTPAGGQVQVTVDLDERHLALSVADNGIGIAPTDQAHVFDKFYRVTSDDVQAISGTGLGLALAREVARLHGGDIRLESVLGAGSKFTFELPLPREQKEVAVR